MFTAIMQISRHGAYNMMMVFVYWRLRESCPMIGRSGPPRIDHATRMQRQERNLCSVKTEENLATASCSMTIHAIIQTANHLLENVFKRWRVCSFMMCVANRKPCVVTKATTLILIKIMFGYSYWYLNYS